MKLKCRNVSESIAEHAKKYLAVNIVNKRICANCNIKVYRLKENQGTSSDCTPAQSERVSPPIEISTVTYQNDFSEACVRLGGSPVRISKLSKPGYRDQQLSKIVELTCKNVLQVPVTKARVIYDDQPDLEKDEEDLLSNIKEAFVREENYKNKIYLLSLLPEHWSTIRVMDQFGATRYMVDKAKKVATEKGHGS